MLLLEIRNHCKIRQ